MEFHSLIPLLKEFFMSAFLSRVVSNVVSDIVFKAGYFVSEIVVCAWFSRGDKKRRRKENAARLSMKADEAIRYIVEYRKMRERGESKTEETEEVVAEEVVAEEVVAEEALAEEVVAEEVVAEEALAEEALAEEALAEEAVAEEALAEENIEIYEDVIMNGRVEKRLVKNPLITLRFLKHYRKCPAKRNECYKKFLQELAHSEEEAPEGYSDIIRSTLKAMNHMSEKEIRKYADRTYSDIEINHPALFNRGLKPR
jgi:flagellar biosynthesis GTPase FlhF